MLQLINCLKISSFTIGCDILFSYCFSQPGSQPLIHTPIPRYFSFRPITHLGACSQATNKGRERERKLQATTTAKGQGSETFV